MTAFRFRLEKALEWRRTQFEIEEAAYQRELAALAAVEHAQVELEAAGAQAEVQIRDWKDVSGADLAALGGFRRGMEVRKTELVALRADAARKVMVRQATMLAAKKLYRLLERLREKRLQEWLAAEQRELEAVASESYLAGYCRARTRHDRTSL